MTVFRVYEPHECGGDGYPIAWHEIDGGPGVKANLTLDYGQDRLGISVLDDGRGVVGPLAPGHGLVGMHERVSLLAGELHTGARPGGGFAVQATIPVPA